jgi:hypothetical protein
MPAKIDYGPTEDAHDCKPGYAPTTLLAVNGYAMRVARRTGNIFLTFISFLTETLLQA